MERSSYPYAFIKALTGLAISKIQYQQYILGAWKRIRTWEC